MCHGCWLRFHTDAMLGIIRVLKLTGQLKPYVTRKKIDRHFYLFQHLYIVSSTTYLNLALLRI